MTKSKSELTGDLVRSLFKYSDGKLLRKTEYRDKKIGDEAGWTNAKGYRKIQILGSTKTYSVHSLVWLYFNNEFPPEIDHINGDRSDNRIENLRSVSRCENMQNRPCHRDGRPVGVFFYKAYQKWYARAPKQYLNWSSGSKFLGYFDTMEEAGETVRRFCQGA
jgi:hypothetical protein